MMDYGFGKTFTDEEDTRSIPERTSDNGFSFRLRDMLANFSHGAGLIRFTQRYSYDVSELTFSGAK